jgi:hypothetical protein
VDARRWDRYQEANGRADSIDRLGTRKLSSLLIDRRALARGARKRETMNRLMKPFHALLHQRAHLLELGMV